MTAALPSALSGGVAGEARAATAFPYGSAIPARLRIPDCFGAQVGPHGSRNPGDVAALKACGFAWTRLDIPWSSTEKGGPDGKTKHVYDWAFLDSMVKLAEDAGLGAILILNYGNALYDDANGYGGTPPRTPEAFEGFARWAVETIRKYKGRCGGRVVFEIWNEPNGQQAFWPLPDEQRYERNPDGSYVVRNGQKVERPYTDTMPIRAAQFGPFLLHVARRIKEDGQAAPATVAAPGMISLDDAFLEDIFHERDGAGRTSLAYLDAVSLHPYRKGPPETVVTGSVDTRGGYGSSGTATTPGSGVRGVMSPHNRATNPEGRDVKLVATEFGYSNYVPDSDHPVDFMYCTSEDHPRLAVRTLLMQLVAGVPLTIWYEWEDAGTDPNDREHHLGIVDAYGNPKPAHQAVKTMFSTLNNSEYVSRMQVGDPATDWMLRFRRDDGRTLYALWTTGTPRYIRVRTNKAATRTTMNGQTARVRVASDGTINSYFQASPQYLLIDA